MRAITIIAFLILASCGQQRDQPSEEYTQAIAQTQTSITDKEVTVGAQYFATESDLPDCDESRARDLVYIKETGYFKYCDQNEWVAIDLKGQKGEKGDRGETGAFGRDGANGANGLDGKDAQTIASNEWVDPISEQKWFLGRYISPKDFARETQVCPQGSHAASDDEIKDASYRGIFTKLASYFSSNKIAILNTVAESSSSWVVSYVETETFVTNSRRIVLSDFSISLDAFWTSKTYILCVVD